MWSKKLFFYCAIILLMCSLILELTLSTSERAQAAHSADVVSSTPLSTSRLSMQNYWTADRMKAARPATKMIDKNDSFPPVIPSELPGKSQDPVLPKNSAITSSVSASDVELMASAVPHPYPFPYSTVGKVFFTDPRTGTDYVCSGTAVSSNNRNTVDTAGHCLAAGGGRYFYTNWIFCAQYFNGCSSRYMWVARQLFTHNNWYSNGWLTYDYGAAVLSPNDSGSVVNVVGGAGWAYNRPYNQRYTALGYPAGPPFNGSRLWTCTSQFYAYDNPDPGPTALGITCDMTGGSSGGGWLITIGNTFGYVNGHNDYKYSTDPNRMYSPYYGSDWFSVFNAAQNA